MARDKSTKRALTKEPAKRPKAVRDRVIQQADVSIEDPLASTFFSRLKSIPSTERKQLYNVVFLDLRQAGILDNLDALYLLAAADIATACTNLVQRAHDLTPLYEPIFTADRGIAGNGKGAYLNAGLNPAGSPNLRFQRDSAHLGFYNRTERSPGHAVQMGCHDGASICTLAVNYIGQRCYGQLNDASDGVMDKTAAGFFLVDRTSKDSRRIYINDKNVGGDIAAPSRPLPNVPMYVLARNNQGKPGDLCTDELAAVCIGGGLGPEKAMRLREIVEDYLAAVGAKV